MKLFFYQIVTRLWGEGKMSSFDPATLSYIKGLGVDYLWYTGIPEHATLKPFVKGDWGSPYAIEDWGAVNPYLADDPARAEEEFRALVRRTHEAGMKVCIDFIPNHVARDYAGPLPHFDYYDYDWSDTCKVDWSHPATVPLMTDILDRWAGMGVDAFRVDMAEMVPPELLGRVVRGVKERHPGVIFAAEVYDRNNYRRYAGGRGLMVGDGGCGGTAGDGGCCCGYDGGVAGFDLLYDKSGVYDILRGISRRQRGAQELTWNWQFLGDLQPSMLNFLENHDEQRLASAEFLGGTDGSWALLAYAALFNTASFMMYFGQEVGTDARESDNGRTSIFSRVRPESLAHLARYAVSGKGLSRAESAVLRRYRALLGHMNRPLFREGDTWDLNYCQPAGGVVSAAGRCYSSAAGRECSSAAGRGAVVSDAGRGCSSAAGRGAAVATPFDAGCHSVFLRYRGSEAAVAFCNFSDAEADLDVVIPEEMRPVAGRSVVRVRAAANDYAVVECGAA